MNHLTTSIVQRSVPDVTPTCLDDGINPCISSLQLDVGCPVVIAAAIPDAMLLPTDECFTQEVPEHAYDGISCPKYTLWDSNPGSWLAKEQKSQLRFGGRRLLLLNDEAWRCHPYTQAL